MPNKKFTLAQPHNLSPMYHRKRNFFTELINNKMFIFLTITLLMLVIFSLCSFIFNNKVPEILFKLGIEKNIKTTLITQNNIVEITYNPESNSKIKILEEYLINNNINYNIDKEKIIPILSFNIKDLLSYWDKFTLALGSNNSGESVLIVNLQKFSFSILYAISIFIIELFFSLPIGCWISINKKSFKILNSTLAYLISIPDLLIFMFILVMIKNFLLLTIILILTGIIRMTYWTIQFAISEVKKEYMIILVNSNMNKISIIYKHLIPKIVSKILTIFSARIGYILGLISTINLIGFPIQWNVLNNIREYWKFQVDNILQVLFPLLYLSVFLISFRIWCIAISRTIDVTK
ncbi:ABC transporter permease subunit [Mycoplasmopsis anatis]|uniref:ABC transporter permease subunit n=2 Tax=Mycoplasmopsis anatis TaxID=171279 RepID=A0A9Q3QDM5_9BACT|nr:ABC transporter permease subunit [Mycoplasmopsis anatis]MBW0594413.1 ABC transporter permease subunit [Mycoplasmopsis anatis]MBW0595267.1 ABC transporter permease subunit [Mycoplasmopsis anatis]MBW0596307.1 ABC transporter permease subunit [Mycoplasmopsis anatis]MBW0596443.1 ABC transporter permease subunit [Mycoplasmopsis anatis]MBW0597806.1 ABC transporter permease subunit [Mycoplasmopsis anatis]